MNEDSIPTADSVPASYRYWQNAAKGLLEPLLALMQEGEAHIPIQGKASDHCLDADRLEAFARPFLLFCHWEVSLRNYREESDLDALEKGKAWFRKALLLGTDSQSDQFFGYSTNYRQHSVEMGLLGIAFEMSREWLWDGLDAAEREQVLLWLESDAGNGHHWNNHLFFGVFLLEFLAAERGENPRYRAAIDWYFEELERMYSGDGWYMDGSNQAYDFYNAYAWHFYPLWWIRLYSEKDVERCQRFSDRTRLFLENYSLFFADNGEHPAFGRSIAYRFNATAPIALAYLVGASPLSPAESRSLCTRNLEFFLTRPIEQSQGCLSIGWVDEFPELAESYSCGGSPYWAAKGFAPLLLPPSDPFWTEEAAAPEGDRSVALQGPNLVVRKVNGASEIVNVGTQIGSSNTRFGVHKWGRLSYKSGWGFTLPKGDGLYPLDGSLTAQMKGSELVYGRHGTVPLALESERMACMYSLGGKVDGLQVSVETSLFWKGDWQLAVHRCRACQDVTLRFGSYSLSYDEDQSILVERGETMVEARTDEKAMVLQMVAGYEAVGLDERASESDGPRRSIQAPFHVTGLLLGELGAGESVCLVSLSYAGANSEAAKPWKILSCDDEYIQVEHPTLGVWEVRDF
ncbi:DUF2264 domain-containing protein [Pelagicoccus sp. SDUM812005]|uniref:DUF2264 domain-containing protein n=1 Tax=Pelagicoccus sp. SDUM812005 TaxID=3041257 RepID=UPI00280D7AAE|nr:DUF2264 domain-containing protein [Pelagicoccus sp. SDUM812005]MDQ8179940.1 DUF2264 domain-containing protein [Pelagicoccus sp. SDUM812005]